jgi:hypothetical protein
MSRLSAVTHRDVKHKHSALTSVTVARRCVTCVQQLLVVERRGLLIKELRGGRRKLRKEKFVDLCVGMDDEFMEGEMYDILTYMGVKNTDIFVRSIEWRKVGFCDDTK